MHAPRRMTEARSPVAPPLKYVQIAKKASTRLKAKKKTKGEITTTMVRTRARELPSHRTGPDPTRHAHAFRSL